MELSPPGSRIDAAFAAPPESSPPFGPRVPDLPRSVPATGPSTEALGPSGIRVESFAVGKPDGDALCGEDSQFSVSADDRAYVCFEVVHARREEDVVVVWSRGDVVERRTTVEITPDRSQFSRVYLAATTDRIGQWTVQLVAGGEILAEGEFEIVR